jgi:hypothetical protein
MADRNSAGIFGDVFIQLSLMPASKPRDKMARFMWGERNNYDFSDDQMGCDDALIKLKLAKRCPKCKGAIYKGDDGCVNDC